MSIDKRRFVPYLLIYAGWLSALSFSTGLLGDGMDAWAASWVKWDAHWYERIWREGYPQADPRMLVFPPGYSGLIGVISAVSGMSFHFAALLTNVIAYFAFAVIAAQLMALVWQVPALAVFAFTLSAPAAYFIFTSYSDAVFGLWLWVLLYLAIACPESKRARILEAVLLLLVPWLRLTGYALGAWLLLKRWGALAILVSLGGWLALNFAISGSPLYFLEAQKLFLMPDGGVLGGVIYTFTGLKNWPMASGGEWTSFLQFHLLPAIYFATFAAVGVWASLKKRPLIGLTILAVLVFSHNQSFWRSAVRYDLPLFPFLCLPLLSLRKRWRIVADFVFAAVVLMQLILQLYFAGIFKAGGWAF